MSKKKWYKRAHQFTPYTTANGQAVSDEFDAIQASFERIPEMRDDGKGFAVSPLIPEPTDPNHPVPFKMLTETEASVNNARDDVIAKAQQVAQNTQTVETNTQTAIGQANSATQSAISAAASSQSADESEDWARKWASNPIDEPVSGDKYSAHHYASKAAKYAENLSTAEQSAKTNADIAVQKAKEAKQSAKKAESLAAGEVEYEKILNVPRADTSTEGIVRLTDDTGLDSNKLGLTARAGKKLAQWIAGLQLALNNYIPLNKRSSAVNSNSNENVATSAAVKMAYDKGVEAKNAADNAQTAANNANKNANGRVPKEGNTTILGTVRAQAPNMSGGQWSAWQLATLAGYWQLEAHPESQNAVNRRLNLLYIGDNGDRKYLAFPTIGDRETVAYQSWTDNNYVKKSGGSMTGTLKFTGATENYNIGNYTWRMPIEFSGNMFIGNEVTGIGFNNNGSLGLGGRPNSKEFLASIDGEGIYTGENVRASDVTLHDGKKLSLAHQRTDKYVETTTPTAYGGVRIIREARGDEILIESNNLDGISFVQRKAGKNIWTANMRNKTGTIALLEDLSKIEVLWEGWSKNEVKVNANGKRGLIFVKYQEHIDGRYFWGSVPLEQLNEDRCEINTISSRAILVVKKGDVITFSPKDTLSSVFGFKKILIYS